MMIESPKWISWTIIMNGEGGADSAIAPDTPKSCEDTVTDSPIRKWTIILWLARAETLIGEVVFYRDALKM